MNRSASPTPAEVIAAASARKCREWAILEPELYDYAKLVTKIESRTDFPAIAAKPATKPTRRGRASVILINGVLVQRTDWLSKYLGEVGTEDIGRMLDLAAADDATDVIVLAIHSPGGTVYGVPELGAKIADVSKSKRTIAVIDPVAGSGAYWIASQCRQIVITPSGEVGSIGVFLMHVDQSKAMDDAGVKVTQVYAGKNKVATNQYEPLSDDGRELMQSVVDDYYDMFIKAVATGRGVTQKTVRDDFGQGAMLRAESAVKAGMVDKIGTFESVLAGFSGVKLAADPNPNSAAQLESKPEASSTRRPSKDPEAERRWLMLEADQRALQAATKKPARGGALSLSASVRAEIDARKQKLAESQAADRKSREAEADRRPYWLRQRMAFHEAAHAVAIMALGGSIKSVTLVPETLGDASGGTIYAAGHVKPLATGPLSPDRQAATHHAGPIGEALAGAPPRGVDLAIGDRRNIALVCPDPVAAERGRALAAELVKRHEPAIRELATQLLVELTVDGIEAAKLMDRHAKPKATTFVERLATK